MRERSRDLFCVLLVSIIHWVCLYNCVTRNQTMKPNIQRDIILHSSGSRRPQQNISAKCLLSLFSRPYINHKSSRDTSLSQLYCTSWRPSGQINQPDQFKLILINGEGKFAQKIVKERIWNVLHLIDDNC